MISAAVTMAGSGFLSCGRQAHYDGPGVCPLEGYSSASNRSRHPFVSPSAHRKHRIASLIG
jgi:hypothetical protein